MACSVRRVEYFSTTVKDQLGDAYKLLKTLADLGINLHALGRAIRCGEHLLAQDRLELDGPHPALLVQGDDELGALAEIHMKLSDARVNVYASTGVADGRGSFGYIIYVRPEEFARASAALGL